MNRGGKVIAFAALLGALGVSLVACGQSDEAKAQDYAVKACGITMVEDESGTSTATYSSDAEGIDPGLMPMAELEDLLKNDEGRAADAAAAAQLDASWQELATGTSDLASAARRALEVRKDGYMGDKFWQVFTPADRAKRGDGIQKMDIACTALASRMN